MAEYKAAAGEKHFPHLMTSKKNRIELNANDQLGRLATGALLLLGMNLDLNSLNMNTHQQRLKFTGFVHTKHKLRPSAPSSKKTDCTIAEN